MPSLLARVGLAAVFLLGGGAMVHPAGAAPAPPPGAGGCSAKTLACYPSCRYEWTGQASQLGQPTDDGPCPWEPDVTTVVNVAEGSPGMRHVTVDNFPASVLVDRGADWPDSGTAPAADVRVINETDEPVNATVGGASLESWWAVFGALGLGLGVLLGRVLFPGVNRGD